MPKGDKNRGGKAKRNAEIMRLRLEEKLTYEAIGKRYNLSKQRVQQIILHPYKTSCESIPNVDAV